MREIIGIGNDLFGDDGFGPMVVGYIKANYMLAPDVEVIDAGSSPDFLLNELLETETKRIIIIDVFDNGGVPGEISILSSEDLPDVFPQRLTHNMPIAEIIRELSNSRDMDIKVIACQPEKITVPDVCVGLSKPLVDAVPKAADLAVRLINQDN
ncbi:MAG: hydrogenase maturation protease [Candidatus Altiarchaeota archaeon]|nr:hydrogenase maturation protease [Candidatus Altiarchaeota archaeon]